MRIENNLHPYETVTQHTSLARMASKIWIMYLNNKAAEISTRVLSLFFFGVCVWSVQVSYTESRFIFSADSGIDEQ